MPKACVSLASAQSPDQSGSLGAIAEKLSTMRFKRAIWGVDERDVIHKIQRIDEMYRELYQAQELRYQTLLEDREQEIRRLAKSTARSHR